MLRTVAEQGASTGCDNAGNDDIGCHIALIHLDGARGHHTASCHDSKLGRGVARPTLVVDAARVLRCVLLVLLAVSASAV